MGTVSKKIENYILMINKILDYQRLVRCEMDSVFSDGPAMIIKDPSVMMLHDFLM